MIGLRGYALVVLEEEHLKGLTLAREGDGEKDRGGGRRAGFRRHRHHSEKMLGG